MIVFGNMLTAAELKPRTVLRDVYIQRDNGWLLVDRPESSKNGWTSLTLDAPAYLELDRSHWQLGWNGSRFARGWEFYHLWTNHPHVCAWFVRRLRALSLAADA